MKIVAAGIIATSVMTAFMYVMSVLAKKQLRVVHILGTMVTNRVTVNRNISHSPDSIFMGSVLHYLVGIGFAYCYYFAWTKDIIVASLSSALFMGVVNGIVAVAVWRLFIGIHPRPPKIPVVAYLTFIFCGHLFFAMMLWVCYYFSESGHNF